MRDTIKAGLLIGTIFSFLSAIMWTLTEPSDHYLWFSRWALGWMCAGFLGLILKNEKK